MAAKPVTEAPTRCSCSHWWIEHDGWDGVGCLVGWDAEHKGCSCDQYMPVVPT